jgi:uncharacterized alpha-E superfamily protein
MSLLSRVADRIYWGARYVERAEDTARVIRSFGDLLVELPSGVVDGWEPLLALAGSGALYDARRAAADPEPDGSGRAGESDVVRFLVADRHNPGSVASSVASARENLRTCREVIPREGWHALNGLYQYVAGEAERGVARRTRDRFLDRVIDDSRRLDGVLESTMTRAHPYRMWRLGRLVERADMTTRVLGVRAAAILQRHGAVTADGEPLDDHEEIQWMSVLRSLSALQMYQRATHGPIDASSVVRFLLFYSAFPRSVQGCLDGIRTVLGELPGADAVVPVLDEVDAALASCDPAADEGALLDDAMDLLQQRIGAFDRAVGERYFALGG